MAATNTTNTSSQESLAHTWRSLVSHLEEMRDPRCDDWWMMSSLWPTILLSTSYYVIVRHAGPRLMKNRLDVTTKGTCQPRSPPLPLFN